MSVAPATPTQTPTAGISLRINLLFNTKLVLAGIDPATATVADVWGRIETETKLESRSDRHLLFDTTMSRPLKELSHTLQQYGITSDGAKLEVVPKPISACSNGKCA